MGDCREQIDAELKLAATRPGGMGRPLGSLKGRTAQANEFAGWLRRITAGVTVCALEEDFPYGKSSWSGFRDGSRLPRGDQVVLPPLGKQRWKGVAEAAQDTVMELLRQVWPLCPEHGWACIRRRTRRSDCPWGAWENGCAVARLISALTPWGSRQSTQLTS